MITVRSLVPLSIAVLVVGLVTGSLLVNGSAIGPWLLAALLVAHGLLHVAFAISRPAGVSDWPFDLARSWLVVRAGVDAGLVRAIGRVLVAAIVVGLTLAAAGALGFIVPPDAWTFVVAGAASLSLVLLAIVFAATVLVGVGIRPRADLVRALGGVDPGGDARLTTRPRRPSACRRASSGSPRELG